MPFDPENAIDTLHDCFDKSGVSDFDRFLGAHLGAEKWIVASDYNIGSPGSKHDVFAFACYPMEKGWEHLNQLLTSTFPADFKGSRITREQKRFFENSPCFCFVFLITHPRKILRTGNRAADLVSLRERLKETLALNHPSQGALVERFYRESLKANFSLTQFENILLLCTFHAFVTGRIALRTPTKQVGWFPDRDNMTTYCDAAWSGLAVILFEGYWRKASDGRPSPAIHIIDHRVKGIHDVVDPLIRVPDFFAATLSRTALEGRSLSLPEERGRGGAILTFWVGGSRKTTHSGYVAFASTRAE